MTEDEPRKRGFAGNLATILAPYLPYLRRFARALSGDQTAGDARVAATLEALIADRTALDASLPPRVALYKLFLRLWSDDQRPESTPSPGTPERRLARLPARSRQVLLLTTAEEFSLGEAAAILELSQEATRELIGAALKDLEGEIGARVMIIEDEPVIALDLERIVDRMGHRSVGVAATHELAVALARETRPDLILADIQLADGSSGIDAVEDIIATWDAPVIFITAFPERLLTGNRPEPTFLVTKPFRRKTVEATISQALYHTQGA